MKFRKKPVVVEAFLWTGDLEQVEDPEWACQAITEGRIRFWQSGTPEVKLLINTLEGVMEASRGDYIIRGVEGEIYPCKPGIFERTYETLPEDEPGVCSICHQALPVGEEMFKFHGYSGPCPAQEKPS